MANEEVLGPRKTMFILVIVVGCFAVLWPRYLSPMFFGPSRDHLKPNQFDRDAGCCEVIFETEVAVLELLNEVCSSIAHTNGKLSPYAAAECRRAVNETCGVDIQAFLKRTDNVGKTTKALLEIMKASNSSCLKEHFGVPIWSMSTHPAFNSWMLKDTVKQERRPPIRAGPHPALMERGRAIPSAGGAAPAPQRPTPLPPHIRVRTSPLQGYFEVEVKPPPIPGMRPPLGAGGGPMPAPKSSMGFIMPIYTICIIIFFVYTLSKILFRRTSSPYEQMSPDPQFRRRVFRDDSRSSPDKLGDIELEALRARLAETERAMQRIVGQLAARDAESQQANNARPYTNGTVIHSGPVQIVASEYKEPSKEKSPVKEKEPSPEPKEPGKVVKKSSPDKEPSPDIEPGSEKEPSPDIEPGSEKEPVPVKERSPEPVAEVKDSGAKESSTGPRESTPKSKEASPEPTKDFTPEPKEPTPEPKEPTPEPKQPTPKESSPEEEIEEEEEVTEESSPEKEIVIEELKKITDNIEILKDSVVKLTEDFLNKEKSSHSHAKRTTSELLEEALKEDSPGKDENATVKHKAEDVKSIYLETEIPQQSRVLVADFKDTAQSAPATKHAPLVVSGKMTLSLIQDAPRDTPERDPESTVDEFTTASAVTQPANEEEEDQSDEEIEEEIEVEEIEEEEEDPAAAPANQGAGK